MRHTKKVPVGVGGAIMITYDSEQADFEKELGEMMLDAGGLR